MVMASNEGNNSSVLDGSDVQSQWWAYIEMVDKLEWSRNFYTWLELWIMISIEVQTIKSSWLMCWSGYSANSSWNVGPMFLLKQNSLSQKDQMMFWQQSISFLEEMWSKVDKIKDELERETRWGKRLNEIWKQLDLTPKEKKLLEIG